MWLSIICLGAIVAVAIKVGGQGLFGAFIMLVLSICCLGLAFGLYEWLAITLIAPNWQPDYALPVALGVLFGIPLLILRIVFDRVIRRACLLPGLVDKIGGGVFGLLTGLILVGVLATCIQMMPFSYGSFLGFARVKAVPPNERLSADIDPASSGSENGLMLSPDSFSVGLASILSDGIFSGEHSFGSRHPDLLQAVGWSGAVDLEVSRFAQPGSIGVVRTAVVPYVYKMTPGNERRNTETKYEPQTPEAGQEFRMVRVSLKQGARDKRNSHVFTLKQFKLVGANERGGSLRQYHPVAIQQEDAADVTNRHVVAKQTGTKFWPIADEPLEPREGNNNEVEVVFALPTGFEPRFIEYKRMARVPVSFDRSDGAAPPNQVTGRSSNRESPERTAAGNPPVASTAPDRTSTPPRSTRGSNNSRRERRRPSGGVRGVTANSAGSHFGDDLPVEMTSYQALQNADISLGVISAGHMVGDYEAQVSGTQPGVNKFSVPSDKRLLHLASQGLQSGSILGKALSTAVMTVQNYFVTDEQGKRYKIIGKYAIGTVNDKKVVEVQYFKDQMGTIGGVGKFNRIDESKLGASDTFALLFLVDPGVKIVSFSTGGSSGLQEDLTDQNLIAPQ